jgi:hypothetical protein
MSECEMGVLWVFYYVTVNSFVENIALFSDNNKTCEVMQRGIFGTRSCKRYPTCHEVTSNSTVINKILMKQNCQGFYHYVTPHFFLIFVSF